MEIIKEFTFKSTTSSLNERKKLFDQVYMVLENRLQNQIPDAAYKILSKINYYLFPIYIDKYSKENLITLNNFLIEIDSGSSAKIILTSLEFHSKNLIGHPNRSSSTLGLYGQDLLNGLIKSIFEFNKTDLINTELQRISKIYSTFCLVSYSYNCGKYFNSSYKRLKNILKKTPVLLNKFISSLLSDTENQMNNLLLFGYLLKYLSDINNIALFHELKVSVNKIYIESIIGSRLKLNDWLIGSSNFFLKYVTKEEFKIEFLPELKRSLLRNPEIIMQSLRLVLKDLIFDFDEILLDLLPSLNSQLLSKEEIVQIESIEVIKILSSKCKNIISHQEIIKSLFDLLISVQGKLLSSNQKQKIITAIGNCFSNYLVSNENMVSFLLIQFENYLKTETNEQLIANMYQQLKKLLVKFNMLNFSQQVILNIKNFFQIQLDIKSYSVNIRNNIFQAIGSVFWAQKLRPYAENFKNHCIASLEKVQNQFVHNSSVSNEIISVLLILALNVDPSTGSDILSLIDSKRNIITNEKFLFSLDENGYSILILLIERLIEIKSVKTNEFDNDKK